MYSESGDVFKLASNLNQVLKTPAKKLLLTEIRPFVPQNQQTLFENLTGFKTSSFVSLNTSSNSNKFESKPQLTSRSLVVPKGKR